MIDIEKFICSLIHRSSGFCVIKVIDIIDALHYQGLDYKDGKIVRITPEFEESEDERMKKIISDILLIDSDEIREILYANNILMQDIDAWLEKQGDQEKSVKFKPSFRVGDMIKPKDPVLGEPRIIERVHPTWGYDTNKGILDFEFEDNWELVEQIPTWSEEDEIKIKSIVAFLKSPSLCAMDGNKDIINANIKYLKSLKERYTWKPSKEQMEVLVWCMPLFADPKSKGILESLINDLKKLKEK